MPEMTGGNTGKSSGMIFQRLSEPSENAFTLLVPKDWTTRGGMMRFNAAREVVSAQNIEAKTDFAVLRDPAGQVMLRWCPHIVYCDMRFSPMGQMGMFPQGSNYNGMPVLPVMPAAQFLVQIMFPWAHPQAQNARLLDQKPYPELQQRFEAPARQRALPFQYDAATVTYTYSEGGVEFREQASTAIENMGQAAAGMWSNKDCHYFRAPAAEFDSWLPAFSTIYHSVKLNPDWVAEEMKAQQILTHSFMEARAAERYRAQKVRETQDYIHNVEREIREHRDLTQAEIRNDQYLMLTGQEEYVNPITNEVDLGSNEWNYRWVNPNGDVYYSDHEGEDPNNLGGGVLDRTDWQRTPVRPRFPQG